MPKRAAPTRRPKGLTYADAGVALEAKDQFTESLDAVMRRTHGPRVISNPGGFAGLFRLDFNEKLFRRNYREPVLVACCDGVGTKIKLASELGIFDTVGIDLVAMSINDLIVQGAEPLFFLDYIAVPKVERAMLDALVRGVAEGCKAAGCALLGGETAEMPDVYAPGEFDLAGFAVGVVELERASSQERVRPGDVVLGLASAGIHSNGYSLVRRVVKHARIDLGAPFAAPGAKGRKRPAESARTIGQVLLTPTRIYSASITKMLRAYRVKQVVTGMAHITGSGIQGNLERALNPSVDAVIDSRSWTPPPVFRFLQQAGNIEDAEMWRVFNMGVGYCVVCRPAFATAIKDRLTRSGEKVSVIGKITKGTGRVLVS